MIMSRSSIDQVRKLIEGDFVEVPEIGRACFSIVDFIANESDERLKHLTFGMLVNVSNIDSQLASKAIAYLSGDRAQILSMRFEFIDEKNEIYFIKTSTISEARKTGEFIHPELGIPVLDFEKMIYIYFTPSWITEVEEF